MSLRDSQSMRERGFRERGFRLGEQHTASLQKSPSKGGWMYIVWPESVEFFKRHASDPVTLPRLSATASRGHRYKRVSSVCARVQRCLSTV